MVKEVNPHEQRQQNVTSAFCPNCGVPKAARFTLMQMMKRKKAVIFRCKSCGFYVMMLRPDKKQFTGGPNEEPTFDVKDFIKGAKEIKSLAGLLGKL